MNDKASTDVAALVANIVVECSESTNFTVTQEKL